MLQGPREFLSWLKSPGLRGVRMFTGDKAAEMVGSIAEVFPGGRPPALHRALLPQRAGQGPEVEEAEGRGDAQGRARDGVARGVRNQGARRGRGTRVHACRYAA